MWVFLFRMYLKVKPQSKKKIKLDLIWFLGIGLSKELVHFLQDIVSLSDVWKTWTDLSLVLWGKVVLSNKIVQFQVMFALLEHE